MAADTGTNTAAGTIGIEVCYASDTVQLLRALRVAVGTTIGQAIALSGIQDAVPGIDWSYMQVGIYARKKAPDTVLREHDRIEIYRPLIADPKNARRRRKPASPAV